VSEASNRWERKTRFILTADRVRALLDDPDATVPIGIDPETIAAARRIARRLQETDDGG
jgi:hypothetical protein